MALAQEDAEEQPGAGLVVDEETDRKLWLLKIESAVLTSIKQQRLIQEEINILQFMAARQHEGGNNDRGRPPAQQQARVYEADGK